MDENNIYVAYRPSDSHKMFNCTRLHGWMFQFWILFARRLLLFLIYDANDSKFAFLESCLISPINSQIPLK